MSERFIQSVERAADILELFLNSEPELSVKEISEQLGLSKSTVHGLIKTLRTSRIPSTKSRKSKV